MAQATSTATGDPLLAFLADLKAIRHMAETIPQGMAEQYLQSTINPMDRRIATRDFPNPTTIEGAAAALRESLAAGDMEDMDANFVKAALSFLERTSIAPPSDAPSPRIANRPDVSTAFSNITRLVDLANWLMLDGMNRIAHPEHGAGFFIREREGEQLSALLVVLSHFAEREMAEAYGTGRA